MDKKSSILVVDDQRVNLEFIEAILEDEYDVVTSNSGQDALVCLKSKEFDLILLDIHMPDIDGFEVAKQIENDPKKNHIPFIFVTADKDNETLRQGFELGASDFLTKPINAIELQLRVKTHIDNKKAKEKEAMYLKQSRMAQMGEMIAMIAHQWRQPLSALSSNVATIQVKIKLDRLNLEDEAKNYLLESMDNMAVTIENLSTTINDFRNFFKPNNKMETIKLEELCIKTLPVIKSSILNNNINLIEEYNCNEKLDVYPNEMIHVVLNFLKNAQDNFLEKNITDPYIKISTNNKVLSVCDNGGGIPEEIIDKIFDPYFSTKDEKNGTGLGLYMSKMIIEEHHDATLEVENTNDGVCFKIKFE